VSPLGEDTEKNKMATYNVNARIVTVNANSATLLKIGFADPAQNDQIVRDAVAGLEACGELNGELVLFNGPASLPVACALAHGVAHKYGAVACFDPKLSGYVVCITHNPSFQLGQVIPASEVTE